MQKLSVTSSIIIYQAKDQVVNKSNLEGRLTSDLKDTVQLDLATIKNGIYIIYMKPENHWAVAI